MATIKEAAEHAIRFARETLGPERTKGIRLEEVESAASHGQEAWLITLSMLDEPDGTRGRSLSSLLDSTQREYKTFSVLKHTGEVVAMKIRRLAV